MLKTKKSRLILAGDVGGTKTRLAIFLASGRKVRLLRTRDFPSRAYGGLEEIVREFLVQRDRVSAACFGIAGPVVDGVAETTNLPWRIAETSLRRKCPIGTVSLINDLVANAYGVDVLEKKDFAVLNRGRKTSGNKAVISAGTGLGLAILFWDGKRHIPVPSEGGHVEFGPRNRLELSLLCHMFERFGHVSYERVLSGAGLFNIYQFMKDTGKYGKESRTLSEQIRQGDPAAAITEAARLGKSRLCAASLDLFVSIYGAAAGNLALLTMATCGMYIGGGIAPKIIWKLRDGTFMNAFKNKGRLSSIVERVSVKVIMNDRAALLGAAQCAANHLDAF